jgi:hypothetical protein
LSGKPILDFDVIREPWNKYEITSDGAFLKTKIVITKIRKKQTGENKWEYNFDMQPILVILSDEKGTPDAKNYSQEELQAAVVKDDLRYTTVSEEWNEYVVDDGARLRIKSTVSRVGKTSLFDNTGTPQYWIELNNLAQVKSPRTG